MIIDYPISIVTLTVLALLLTAVILIIGFNILALDKQLPTPVRAGVTLVGTIIVYYIFSVVSTQVGFDMVNHHIYDADRDTLFRNVFFMFLGTVIMLGAIELVNRLTRKNYKKKKR